jgi:valyl-tRNA synthetase
MEIASKYNPVNTEDKWYDYWMKQDLFRSTPDDREAFTIVIPPPNVTGVLHMGHMLNNTIQDVLIRRARMMGKNACWVPGTDHASIATESKVVAKLANEGIKKSDLTREDFLKHAFEWKDKHGGLILKQLKKLGASCDWERTDFTMDPGYSKHVINAFIDLYNKGKIYRGTRMINWDPAAQTALSDEEVIHSEEQSKLYYIRYQIAGSDEYLIIATTRPETLLGDTAICVNPNDERFQHLKGKKAIVPIVNREIPIIFDDYVDMEFGTGCLKVTPAHDMNDHELGKKHKLQVIDILDATGKLNENAQVLIGEDRFDARKKIIPMLQEIKALEKMEDYTNKVGRSERSNAVVEPRLSMQWFCDMEEMAKPALENVLNDTIQFFPENSKNTYRHWMENIREWCISRQLWWGHQIPAYYYGPDTNDFVVADNIEDAVKLAIEVTGNTSLTASDLKQDEDVLDTWFSSWLWPIGVFEEEELDYYYPGETIVTGPDIMFFWIARMIMAGYEYKNERPFKTVYYTGLIRDGLGRKMSKSLGNSPDALELIERYGADGVRAGLLLTSAAGSDLKFPSVENKDGSIDFPLCEQGRNFNNKVWNAMRLVKGWEIEDKAAPEASELAYNWFENKLNESIITINDHFSKYRISDALMSIYKLIWDDFCGQYLELVKPEYLKPIDRISYDRTVSLFEKLMQLAHPFMPFITEEIWHLLNERDENATIMLTEWPTADESKVNESELKRFEHIFQVNTQVRSIRSSKGMSPKTVLDLYISNGTSIQDLAAAIQKLANVGECHFDVEKPAQSLSFLVGSTEYFVPVEDNINVEEEVAKLKEQLNYQQGFLNSVSKKLSNERFVNNAPEKVVAIEKQKQADAEAKIKALEEQLAALI